MDDLIDKIDGLLNILGEVSERVSDYSADLRYRKSELLIKRAQEMGCFGEYVWNVRIEKDCIVLNAMRDKFPYLDQVLGAGHHSTFSLNEGSTVTLKFMGDEVELVFHNGETPIKWRPLLGLRFNEEQIRGEVERTRKKAHEYSTFLIKAPKEQP